MKVKDGKEHFLNRMKEVNGNKYTLIGEFKKTGLKTKFRCNICKKVFEKLPAAILKEQGCACQKKMRSVETKAEVQKKIDEVSGQYILLDDFVSKTKKCNVLHKKCGGITKVMPYTIISGFLKECGKCRSAKYNDSKEFLKNQKRSDKDDYDIIGKWGGVKNKTVFLHKKCNKTFEKSPNAFQSMKDCPHCLKAKELKIEQEKIDSKLKEIYNDKIIRISEYVSNKKPIKVKCLKCGREKQTGIQPLLKGTFSCETCNNQNVSGKEKELLKFIRKIYNGPIITSTKTIIKPLELDIYLPELKMAFEFNGNYWHSTKKIKKNYHQEKTLKCQKEQIKLFHVYEFDWDEKRAETEKKIKSLFKKEEIILKEITTEKVIFIEGKTRKEIFLKKEKSDFIRIENTEKINNKNEMIKLLIENLKIKSFSIECDLDWNDVEYKTLKLKKHFIKTPKKIITKKGLEVYNSGSIVFIKHLKDMPN